MQGVILGGHRKDTVDISYIYPVLQSLYDGSGRDGECMGPTYHPNTWPRINRYVMQTFTRSYVMLCYVIFRCMIYIGHGLFTHIIILYRLYFIIFYYLFIYYIEYI